MLTTSGRLLALLSLLQARRDWPGDVLAERLAVSPRTVRRDIDRLRELGYRIAAVKGPDGGYRLAAGSDLPPLLFDDDQAVALAVALQLAATTGAGLGDAVGEAALRALTTVRQVLPARLRRRLDLLPLTVVEPPRGATAGVDPEVLLALGAAVHAREVLRLDYAAPGGDPDPRRVEPHHLVTWRGRWYLVAWDLDRVAWRTLRADRITPRVPTGPRFAPRELPGGDVTTFVTARFRGSETDPRWPCTGEVVLDLALDEVRPFVGDGVAEAAGPGRTRLVQGSWSWAALAASLARFDADLTVVGPPALREAFGVLARRSARAAQPG
ncbi:helix-turn-helix transcriptional regulator [Nocardioides dongkuii]|uniref:helix-turn-helix transcriptional regulator n=1 Tax=Nocardioides dongkuii TaxID=2760089 RepID=UPI0015FD486E|nr:WYL domain-containing protein [Nocardioides dongkuii]